MNNTDNMTAAQAARQVAFDIYSSGYEPHEAIARAFEKFADFLDSTESTETPQQ